MGRRAGDALARTGGVAHVLAPLSESVYLTLGEEIVWLGRPDTMLHGRAMLTLTPPTDAEAGARIALDAAGARLWHPPTFAFAHETPAVVAAGARALRDGIAAVGTVRGFGTLLAGQTPAFPLDRSGGAAQALARACGHDDAGSAGRAAMALIGFGLGLTPSGDDFVGGAFFARIMLAGPDASLWEAAAAKVLVAARGRTHPVSVALLGDLMAGHGHAPLHELACALATGASSHALAAAQRLARLGHSSGWDMLAGFLGGILGEAGVLVE